MSIAFALKKRFTPAILAVLLNYIVWRVGVFLDRFGGDIDVLGAQFCRTTYFLGFVLIGLTVVYAFVRRFALRAHQWDFYGPASALLAVLLMWIESEMSVKY